MSTSSLQCRGGYHLGSQNLVLRGCLSLGGYSPPPAQRLYSDQGGCCGRRFVDFVNYEDVNPDPFVYAVQTRMKGLAPLYICDWMGFIVDDSFAVQSCSNSQMLGRLHVHDHLIAAPSPRAESHPLRLVFRNGCARLPQKHPGASVLSNPVIYTRQLI